MLEDSGMDKKTCGRSNQTTAKTAPEVRKSADSSVSTRYSRRREQSSSKNGLSEPARKPNAFAKQGKFNDKRPKPRGQHYGGGKQETKVEEGEDGPESGPGAIFGRKKQNLNHLLNFTLAPRPAVGSGPNSLKPKERHSNWLATHKHKYNKEEFLQANCQFVVKSGIDYSPYLVDPDILVEWSYIEQIKLRSTELLACPICLDTPLAAKMTRCGHVYCWPCVLHYLALSDKTWRKCPICYEAVHPKDLKSVVTVSDTLTRVGEDFTLKLMKRERDSILAVPMSDCNLTRPSGVPLSVAGSAASRAFSKLLVCEAGDVKEVLRLERFELEAGLRAAEGEPEACFVEQALQLLTERENGLLQNDTCPAVPVPDAITESLEVSNEETLSHGETLPVVADPFEEDKKDAVSEGRSADQSTEETDSDDNLPNVAAEDIETEEQVAGQKPFYFYQAADGQNVFLTALNLRMLETQYGSLAHAPITISGLLLEKESGSMTRELRNRLRSLSHLSITAAFELVELDLSRFVSGEVLEAFADTLRMRAERRRRRERDERRRERRITQQVEKQWGQARAPRIRLDSARHFPRCGDDDAVLEEAAETPATISRSNSQSSLGSSPCADLLTVATVDPPFDEPSTSAGDESAGPSFAQMLKVGANTPGWGRNPRGAWGRPTPAPAAAATAQTDVEDGDGYSAPRHQQSLSDAIAVALERADFSLSEAGIGKKKKRKQKVLFSSGMSFTSK